MKIEFTDKENRIFRCMFAVILFIANGAMMWYSAPELDKTIPNGLNGVVVFGMVFTWIATGMALFKYYK